MYDEENAHIAHNEDIRNINSGDTAHDGTERALIREIEHILLKAFRLAVKSYGESNNSAYCFITDTMIPPASSLNTDDPFNAGFKTDVCLMQSDGNMFVHGKLVGRLAAAFPSHQRSLSFEAFIYGDSQQGDSQYCYDTEYIENVYIYDRDSMKSVADFATVLANVKQVWHEVCEAYAQKP